MRNGIVLESGKNLANVVIRYYSILQCQWGESYGEKL